jgi:4-amino-4-deoxy-L-arabinose transferase-like glycosyltransferase
MKKQTIVVLLIIIIFSAFLRLFMLDKFPPGVTGDEIQQGYTGYSILLTGKDEWGDFMPINPRGFGDYKPPLYSYLTIPFEAVFGLNIWAIRLPSAVSGILLVLVMFFLVKELFKNEKLALLVSFLTAIMSWHIQYSRLAWESNIGLLLFCTGVLFFLKALKKNYYLILSALFFGLSLFTYHTFKVFTILFVGGLLVFYFKKISQIDKKALLVAVLIFGICFMTVAYGFAFAGAGRRAADAALYNEENLGGLRERQVTDILPNPWNRVINNKFSYIGEQFLQNYLGYFSTTFYVSPFRADATLFNIPGQWLIPFWQFIALILGLIYFTKQKFPDSRILWIWLVLAPIPAALTRDYMHAQRIENILPLIVIFAGLGIFYLYNSLRKKVYKNIFVAVLSIMIIWTLLARIDGYVSHQFNQSLGGMKYGYQEVIDYVEKNKDNYQLIIFTKINSEPQAFVAFYSQMDPSEYQQSSRNWIDFEEKGFKFLDMTNYKLGKYYFKNVEWDKDKQNKNTLIVATEKEVSSDIPPVYTVKDIQGNIVFKVYDTNQL